MAKANMHISRSGLQVLLLSVVVGGGVVAAACGSDGGSGTLGGAPTAPVPTASPDGATDPDGAVVTDPDGGGPAVVIPTWTDAEALAWLNVKCSTCHGINAQGVQQLYYSAWPMTATGVTKEYLETNELTPVAYQTILNRAINAEGVSPSPMPVNKPDAAGLLELRAMLQWFNNALPLAVIDADGRYGNDTSTQQKVVISFKCNKPSTLRQFMGRMFFGALDRPPSTKEMGVFTPAQIDEPVTLAQRLQLASLLETTLKTEFIDSGLHKLAGTIGAGPSVAVPPANVPANVAADLREEFYRLFIAKFDTLNYDQFFTSKEVMVTANTAPLYKCTPPTSGWASCTLPTTRDGYFTTVGFLTSRPQTFLSESNNYGRVARMYFTVYGEGLLPATAGPSGEAIPALPTCLEATDTRAFAGAPRGSAAVPLFGKVCQSCHISRHMGAGSILFRPFATDGSLYDPATLGQAGTVDADRYMDLSTDPEWKVSVAPGAPQADGAFLKSLLTASLAPKACILTGGSTYVPVTKPGELAARLMSNKAGVARGFMRHAHRAFSNSPTITLEMGLRAMQVFDGKNQRLSDLVRAYFLSDSLACEVP